MLLELIIYVPKLDLSLYFFPGFLTLFQLLIVGIHFPRKGKLLYIKPDFASGAPYESNWHLFKCSELKSLKLLKPFTRFKHQTPVSAPSADAEMELCVLSSHCSSCRVLFPTISSQRDGIISLNTRSDCANQYSPWDWSRWHHVGERKHDRGHCYSALHKDRSGLRVHNRTRNFFFSPYHWCLLICPVHREHPLMFCFHVSALLHGYRKEYCKLIFLPCLCWECTPITLAPLACQLLLTLPVYNQHG